MIVILALLACATDAPPPVDKTEDVAEPGDAPVFQELEVQHDTAITDLAEDAVAVAPAWLRDDLRLTFQRLDEDDQEVFAALIVDIDEPWILDEVVFGVAHTSPELLEKSRFYPELFVDNARWIYEIEPSLGYVTLVEEGEAGTDDWHTTALYRFEVDGQIEEYTISREMYYWYVAHPRIEDEGAYYIDAWMPCQSNSLECASTPTAGMFWREFLWEGAEEDCPDEGYCPVLRDAMGEAEVLWSDTGGGVGAVGAVAGFMLQSGEEAGRWFAFGAYGERSIQPNRIYALGRGNCGEWGDMTSALSRTALIPNYNATPSSWDHTWNEFYDPHGERWVPWEPVNWWFDHAYGAPYANYGTRGDTRVFHVTDAYTDQTFTMDVAVTDTDGRSIDGATVALWSPFEQDGNTYWWYAGEGTTGPDGHVAFPLAAEKQFGMRIETPAGNVPVEDNSLTYASDGVAVGETDTLDVVIDGSVATAPARELTLGPDLAVASVLVDGTVRAGRIVANSFRYGAQYTVAAEPTPPSWFITDEDGWVAFRDGEPHAVLAEGMLGDGAEIPLDPEARRVFVVVNDNTVSTAIYGSVSLTMSAGEDGDFEGEVAHAMDLNLLPGDYVGVRLRDQ